ncbi:MAG: hypothetical protein AAFN63_17760 [Pseudomonadota bacterium]
MQLKTAIALIISVGSTPVFAESKSEVLSCSAHFEARAIWGDIVGADHGYVTGMERRSKLLFDAYEAANPITPSQDWGMVLLGSPPPPAHEVTHARIVEDTMIYFADFAPMTGQAPLCVEDPICQVCSDVLRSVMP